MLGLKNFSLILVGILFWSVSAEARVCFLAGSDDDENCLTSIGDFVEDGCSGYLSCDIPAIGASTCANSEQSLYQPEDCCSNGSYFERCDGEGQVCNGVSCEGYDANGDIYESCEIGYCSCDSSYSETCSGNGLTGEGEACNGLYQSCKCSDEYYACDAEAEGSGSSCYDDTQKYTSCTCPDADGSTWVSDASDCCFGYSKYCVNRPSGRIVYECNLVTFENCSCGYTYASSTSSCINGCTDEDYEYVGVPENVTCKDLLNGLSTTCGNNCTCKSGYWDFTESCEQQVSTVCTNIGYTDTSCSGEWIACPYDASAKKCLNI